ncbi:MAG: tRNA lysidine(34) synthetase TilS, partial [Deltaproteobacteria bacterium]|nr:tRNA lysidine(34) synthetase TilS [Deltaproteobacteria bacterium]
MMRDLREKALPSLIKLLPPQSKVIVATSGGPDSQVLLDLLGSLAPKLQLKAIFAVGVDHGLRANAGSELDLAEKLAKKHGITFTRIKTQINRNGNILTNARRGRYQLLFNHAKTIAADRIAVAHTATDQAETVLFNLTRGAKLHGAGGIRPRLGLIVRPLLDITHDEILAYLAKYQIIYAEDPSNSDPHRMRAQMRAAVLPALKKLNRGSINNITRFAKRARQDEHLLMQLATRRAKKLSNNNAILEAARHGPLAERTIKAWLKLCCDVRALQSEILQIISLRQNGAIANVGKHKVMRSRNYLWFLEITPKPQQLLVPGSTILQPWGLTITTKIESIGPQNDFRNIFNKQRVAFDADRLHFDLVVRYMQLGDRFNPFGNQGTTKLGDFFT